MTGKRTQIQPSDTTNMSQSETDAVNILFATNNAHKLMEVQAVLGPGFRLVTPRECGVTEEIPEEQQTLEGNASQKAHYLNDRTGLDCFADDTGLEVKALGGAPGVHSARYATDGHDFAANNRLLLKNLEGASDRRAQFRTVISLILNGEEHLFEGVVEGRIIDREEGHEGFGYDPLFIPDGYDKTFAQMSTEEKNEGFAPRPRRTQTRGLFAFRREIGPLYGTRTRSEKMHACFCTLLYLSLPSNGRENLQQRGTFRRPDHRGAEAPLRRNPAAAGGGPFARRTSENPERVAKAMAFLTKGYEENPLEIIRSATFREEYKQMVLVKDIELYSLCESHMLPFYGKAHVAYIPNGHITGLSKIARVVECYARRRRCRSR